MDSARESCGALPPGGPLGEVEYGGRGSRNAYVGAAMTSGASHVPTPDFTLWASGNKLIYPLGHLAGPRGCPEDSLSSHPLMLTLSYTVVETMITLQ